MHSLKRTFSLFILISAVAVQPLRAASEFAETAMAGDNKLQLVGTGTFRYMFFKVYDGALYMLPDADITDPMALVPKRLELSYTRAITAAQLVESGDKILARNVDEQTYAALAGELRMINAAYSDVQAGDRYALVYIPGTGTVLELNGEPLVTVPGEEFAQAYFAIWLGEKSAKRSFRDALINR